MAFLDEIRTFLLSKSIGTPTTIFCGMSPETPEGVIVLYEYGGRPPQSGGRGRAYLERPRLQVVVRDTDYQVARATMQQIYVNLDDVIQQVLSGTTYWNISALASPFGEPRDENQRFRVSCNFEAMKVIV